MRYSPFLPEVPPPLISSKVNGMTDVSVLRDKYRREKQDLWSNISKSAANGRGLKTSLVRLAKLADKLLIDLWCKAGFDQGEALIAVGGYGRGELFPSSDVDVLVMLPDTVVAEDSPEIKAKLESFIGSCWDSGLEIGSSVRTLSDCMDESEKDITSKLLCWKVDSSLATQRSTNSFKHAIKRPWTHMLSLLPKRWN